MTTVYRMWDTSGRVKVEEIDYDYDLHAFKMSRGSREIEVVPISIEQMNEMITELDNGACPYNDGWEDGNSNSISDLLDGCKN